MLPKEYRLKKKTDIDIVFAHGRGVHGNLVGIKVWHIVPDQFPKRGYEKDQLRIAVVVGKKVEKRAVYRNRIKRQIREVLRLLLQKNKIRHGSMVVVFAKPGIIGSTYEEISADVIDTLSRAKILL